MISLKKFFPLSSLALLLILFGVFLLLLTLPIITLVQGWPIILILIGIGIFIHVVFFTEAKNKIKSVLSENDDKTSIQNKEELERVQLLDLIKQDFLNWLKREGFIFIAIITLMGIFGIKSYTDSIFTDVKVQSEISKKSVQDLNIGLEKVSYFNTEVDSLKQELVMVVDSKDQINREVTALKDTIEHVRKTIQKDIQLIERRISSSDTLLRQISQKSIDLERLYKQYEERANAIESERIRYREYSNYTITINYSRRNEARALGYKEILQNLGFKVKEELLTDAKILFLKKYSYRVTYNGTQDVLNKADKIIEQLGLHNFEIERDQTQQESDFMLTIWLVD